MINGETKYNPVSRFVQEIPRELFDIAPVQRRVRDNDYYDYDTSSGGGFRRYDSFRDDESSGFSGFRRNADSGNSYGGFRREASEDYSYSGFKREASHIDAPNPYTSYARPKAVVVPRKTAEEDKPFIAKVSTLAGLTKGSDMQASGGSEVKKGDRVRHIKFGDGTVVNVVKEPRDSKVTVQFDTAGQKIMYASFAKLKKI